MDVSVILVNYNTKDLTLSCIESIIEMTKGIEYEIILVDNASTDGSKALFSSDERIVYLYQEENLGFGKANNLGMSIAKGKYFFLLNSDTILINNAIKELADVLDDDTSIGAVCGNLYDNEGQPTYSYNLDYPSIIRDSYLLSLIRNWLFNPQFKIHNYSNHQIQVKHITGADMMIRKSLIEKYGGFNDHFFMYYEDTELCYRLVKNRQKLLNTPAAKITHLCGKSGDYGGTQKYKLESRCLYFKIVGKNIVYRKTDYYLTLYQLYFRLLLRFMNPYKRKALIDNIRYYKKIKIE